MRIFSCSVCKQVLFFENVQCGGCGHALAYLPEHETLSALESDGDAFIALAKEARRARYRLCENYVQHGACNWAIPAESDAALCASCRLNDVIPNLGTPQAVLAWKKLETAKRRVLYTLHELELPLEPKQEEGKQLEDGKHGLAFAFKEDQAGEKVFTGHSDGLITINIAEADDAFREQTRAQMGEAYRTVLGHVRHEIGHYYWDRLVNGTPALAKFREAFGDEQADYDQARERHYRDGAPPDWHLRFVSAYASMHPWEDWAESFAHYLHMIDTLETASSFGVALKPAPEGGARLSGMAARRLHFEKFDDLLAGWVPLTLALNSLNRSMGLSDPYPFVLSDPAIYKLRVVHDILDAAAKLERKKKR
jgi:hypothetical protein